MYYAWMLLIHLPLRLRIDKSEDGKIPEKNKNPCLLQIHTANHIHNLAFIPSYSILLYYTTLDSTIIYYTILFSSQIFPVKFHSTL